jgi:hypothetical protein
MAMENFHLAATYYRRLMEKESQEIQSIDERNYTPELKLGVKRLLVKRLQNDAATSIKKLTAVLDAFKNYRKEEQITIQQTIQYIRENYLSN